MYKKALKLNDSNTWAQYKVYRNKLTHIKEYAKRLYIKNLVNDNKHDTSSFWKIINKIIHWKNVKKNNIPNKMYASKSESAQGPQAISNMFNKYFIEIGVNLASTIETPAIIDGEFNATSLIQSSCNSFFLEPIVEEEVVNYIRGMNPSKSTGRHGIPAKQRWSRGHKARGQGQGQGHKKNPRPRTAFPRTDTLEAKDRNARGQGQGPRTQQQVFSKKKRSSKKFFRQSPI